MNRIIEVHGGRMWIESEEGQGCTIYLTLPLSSAR
ncbi:MAG: ATP-binding protein [Methanotrichaceae archaeon]